MPGRAPTNRFVDMEAAVGGSDEEEEDDEMDEGEDEAYGAWLIFQIIRFN